MGEARYRHFVKPKSMGKWPAAVVAVDPVGEAELVGQHASVEIERLVSWSAATMMDGKDCYHPARLTCGVTRQLWWKSLADLVHVAGCVWVVSLGCVRAWSMLGLWEEIENGRATFVRRNHGRFQQDAGNAKEKGGNGRKPSPGRAGRQPTTVQELRSQATGSVQSGQAPAGGGLHGMPAPEPGAHHYRPLRILIDNHADSTGTLVVEDPPSIATFWLADLEQPVTWVDARNFGVPWDDQFKQGMRTVTMLCRWWRSWAHLCDRLKLGGACVTAASQAQAGWRRSYLDTPVYCHVHPDAAKLEEESYHGGRCECRWIGPTDEPVWEVDAYGMYGHISLREDLPCVLHRVVSQPTPQETAEATATFAVIARVDLDTDKPDYPVRATCADGQQRPVPVEAVAQPGLSVNSITIYPTGRFTTTLAGPELERALAAGHVLEVHQMALYTRGPALRSYAKALWHERQTRHIWSDEFSQQATKLLANCLPGRLGQRRREWVSDPSVRAAVQYGYWLAAHQSGSEARYRAIAGHVERELVDGFSAEAVPAIASWIASAARVALADWIAIAGRQNCFYWDTDSLVLSAAGASNLGILIHQLTQVPGQLRQKCGPVKCIVQGYKQMRLGDRVIRAGAPRGHVQESPEEGGYWYRRWLGGELYSGARPQVRRELRKWLEVSPYLHGVVQESGNVIPHHVEWL